MSLPPPTLHLLCGKVAAGKSTLARQLAASSAAIVLAEDDWLARLYPGEMHDLADYVRCARRLREVVAPLLEDLLRHGVSVVLDFPANTPEQRCWMRRLIDDAGVAHVLHLLDTSDDQCKARLHRRNAGGDHPYQVSDAQFEAISRHFVSPSAQEGFHVQRHPAP